MTPKHKALIIGLVSFIYYAVLSAKTWTWVFVSQDSGDWLAAAQMWFTPQPYGSPLYIFLAKIVNALPIDLVIGMTILLSALPAAITIAFSYLIAHNITENKLIQYTIPAIMLGSAVLLTQASVVEEYAISIMFVSIAIYAYQLNRIRLWLLMLALGAAVHIIVALLAVIWLLLEWKRRNEWSKHLWIPLVFGVLPYSYLLYTMGTDTPRLIGGGLSLEAINTWAGSTGTIGTMAAIEAPERLIQATGVMLASFGLALVPLYLGFKARQSLGRIGVISAALIVITWFLYLTNRDYTTWTFTTFTIMCVAILITHGLTQMTQNQIKAVLGGALILIGWNSIWLNADVVTKSDPMATDYESALMSIPDGSAVITPRGCATGLGLAYVMASGKDLVPILLYPTAEPIDEVVYNDYLKWVKDTWGIEGRNTLELVKDAFKTRDVYFAAPILPFWEKAFGLKETDNRMLYKVWLVILQPDWSESELETYQ